MENKLESLCSFSKTFPSLDQGELSSRNAPAGAWNAVPNAELMDVVIHHVAWRDLVIVVVDADVALAKYGARLGIQNGTDSPICVGPGDVAGCGDLEIKREGEETDVPIPFAFKMRTCSSRTAMYASMQGDGYIKKAVASALETVIPTSPPSLLVYGHHASVHCGRITLSRAEDLFACGNVPEYPTRDNVGVHAMLDAKNGTQTCNIFSFLPILHFNPTANTSGPIFHLQPMNGSQLMRLFVEKSFTIPAGQTLFPIWSESSRSQLAT